MPLRPGSPATDFIGVVNTTVDVDYVDLLVPLSR
jgi:hypothetical protein